MEKENKSGFRKGISGNPAGRPAGSENKIRGEVREMIKELIEGQADKLGGWFDELEPREKIMAFEKLLQYVIPRKKETEIEIGKQVLQEKIIRNFFGRPDDKE